MQRDLEIWKYFRHEIQAHDLKEISELDWGSSTEKNLKALKQILASGETPRILEWEPREVLELSRWGDYRNDNKISIKQVFFSCFILLAASSSSEAAEYLDGQNENMIIAIDCAEILGDREISMLYEFFLSIVKGIKIEDWEEDYLYFHLSLYILSSLSKSSSERIEALAHNLVEVEKYTATYCKEEINKNIFSYTCFNQKITIWRDFYSRHGGLLENIRSEKFSEFWK
tara:strand:- start:51 stop:737 length:687 start_codon:yes stop_codon:yes gene_type:complete